MNDNKILNSVHVRRYRLTDGFGDGANCSNGHGNTSGSGYGRGTCYGEGWSPGYGDGYGMMRDDTSERG
jgi:hypothetical protein